MGICSIFALFSCAEKRQASNIKSFSYTLQGMSIERENYVVERNGDKATVEIEYYDKKVNCETDTTIFADLQAIIDKHKVHKFKKSYQPSLEILDGEMWNLYVCYENGEQNISSGGSNSWSKNGRAILQEFADYFQSKFIRLEEIEN